MWSVRLSPHLFSSRRTFKAELELDRSPKCRATVRTRGDARFNAYSPRHWPLGCLVDANDKQAPAEIKYLSELEDLQELVETKD